MKVEKPDSEPGIATPNALLQAGHRAMFDLATGHDSSRRKMQERQFLEITFLNQPERFTALLRMREQ